MVETMDESLGDDKLLEYFEHNAVQLFNLKQDPGEQGAPAQAQPKQAGELLAMLRAWRKEVSARMMPAK